MRERWKGVRKGRLNERYVDRVSGACGLSI